MVIRFVQGWAYLRWLHCAALLMALAVFAAPAFAQPPQQETEAAALERIKGVLDQVESTLKDETLATQTLVTLRDRGVAARDELRGKIAELEPRAAEVDARLKQLGPPPAKDAKPEDPAVASEREQITQNFSQVDGALKQARLLSVRADQLVERISERRRSLYAGQVFARSASILDPNVWVDTSKALVGELGSLADLLRAWVVQATDAGALRVGAALLLIMLVIAAAFAITQFGLPRLDDARHGSDTRFARARTALFVFVWLALRTPLALLAGIQVLESFGLLPYRVAEIAGGLAIGVIVAAFGRGVARGLLAPDKPERRIIAIDDATALCLHDHLVWGARILGTAIVLQVTHKTLYTPLAVTVATSALFAAAIAGLMVHLVRCLHAADLARGAETAGAAKPGLRLVGWTIAIVITVALLAGFSALAAFIAARAVVAALVGGALYLLLVAIDTLFTEALAPDTPRGRVIAGNLGVNPRNVGLVGALLSAVIRVILILIALILIVGPWEISSADLAETVQSVPLGFRVGEINVSFRAILIAIAVLATVSLLTRAVQRWLTRDLLPRTSLEPSLQLSISTIFGWIGVISAIALAMGSLGIDLQKIAFVASALAVGIGFGLQSIVSNFVSGLILLAERPIRVGDSIVVGNEEGWVRRIKVRATEIETYDRASVLVPNSLLITGMVKNWTHANTMGRVIVKIGVGYDSEPDAIRDALLAVANEHPQVVKSPPPRAYLVNFGDNALEFELRCVVSNVENRLAVRSDLNLAVLTRFRTAGIAIPVPQREMRARREEEERTVDVSNSRSV